ncbi:Lysosomal beta glucosidase [Linum grandiflorum]
MSRINDAVARILRVKFTMGLFEYPLADQSFIRYLGCQDHRELAREAVRKSLVLLKNSLRHDPNNNKSTMTLPLLPLAKADSKILVAGTHADNLGYQCGGWTIEWQGTSGNNSTIGTTILKAIRNIVDMETSEVVYQENPDRNFVKSRNFSYAIVVVGEKPYAEEYGDDVNLRILEPGPEIVRNVCRSVRCVVVVVSGRPIVIEPELGILMDGLVAAWLPGSEGQGVADVLFGDYGLGLGSRVWINCL